MKHVRVRLSADGREGEIHPMYGALANAPYVERATAEQWNFTGDALGILHYVEGDADAFEAAMAEIPEVLDYDVERVDDGAFYVYVRDATTESMQELFEPIAHGGLVVVPPIVYHEDGTVTVTVFGPDEEIQRGLDRVPAPVEVEIERVGGLAATAAAVEARLTDRQREAIETALALGYYEVPRECSHEDVADAIGAAPSTAAEHLRKAESTVLAGVLGSGEA